MIVLEPDDLEGAAEFLKAGRVVAIATDTVYGLAASLASESAINDLFVLKQRPSGIALPVFVASMSQASELLGRDDVPLGRLAEAWWPGPLTVVVACAEGLASRVRSTDRSIGFRCPDDPTIVGLVSEVGPLCVTSANLHGAAPCTSASEVVARFDGDPRLAGVLDGGRRDRPPSNVVQIVAGNLVELRPGPLSFEDLEASFA